MRDAGRTAGLLLIAGFVFIIPGIAFAVSSQTGSDFVPPTFDARAGAILLAFGAAMVRTGAPARWVGWAAIGWSTGALSLFALPSETYPPLLVQFVPLLLGIALVRAGGRARQRGRFETATGSS